MKRVNRIWITSLCAMVPVFLLVHQFQSKPIYAQQDTQEYDDGTFFIGAYVDVDSSYNLYTDSYMEVEFDLDEDIDAIEVDATVDQDGNAIAADSDDGDDFDPAEVILQSNNPVPPGHEYGVESDGYACFDDGEGDCDTEYIGSAYASVSVSTPLPQITSLSTYSVQQGDKGTLTITGANLVENSGDQLTINLAGGSAPFTSAGTPTSSTAMFSYDFSSYPAGTYTLSVTNNEGTSNGETFTVTSQWPEDPCQVSSSPQAGYTSIVPTGTAGGSGTMNVSFSGAAYAAVSQTVSYGPYSTPSSIAANIAALITANYTQYGLTARAFGPNIVYSGNSTLGTVNYAITGPSVTTTTSSTAEAGAEMACESAPSTPPPACGAVNPAYVLAVLTDSVTWINSGLNHGRNVNYSLELWPTGNGLGAPVAFQSTVTEHLTASMAYGTSTSGVAGTGQFDDILGNTSGSNSGNYITDRCFTITSPTLGSTPIHVMSYDAAGKHPSDHIKITLPNGPSILNNWTNPDGSPKDISIP